MDNLKRPVHGRYPVGRGTGSILQKREEPREVVLGRAREYIRHKLDEDAAPHLDLIKTSKDDLIYEG